MRRSSIHSLSHNTWHVVVALWSYAQPQCDGILDKYVEFDAVILLLDVLLLRVESYRHLIFNHNISNSVSAKCLLL